MTHEGLVKQRRTEGIVLFIDDMIDCFSTVHNPYLKTLNADSAHLQYNKNEFWSIKRGTGAKIS